MASNDTSWSLKWRRSGQKHLSNVQYALYHPEDFPTEADQIQKIRYELRKASECFMFWDSDVADWEKVHTEIPLDQTKVDKQNKHLETLISAEDSE